MISGIRRNNVGAWVAIRNGRYVDTFHGQGSKAKAIRAAGTNTIVTQTVNMHKTDRTTPNA